MFLVSDHVHLFAIACLSYTVVSLMRPTFALPTACLQSLIVIKLKQDILYSAAHCHDALAIQLELNIRLPIAEECAIALYKLDNVTRFLNNLVIISVIMCTANVVTKTRYWIAGIVSLFAGIWCLGLTQ